MLKVHKYSQIMGILRNSFVSMTERDNLIGSHESKENWNGVMVEFPLLNNAIIL